MNWPPDILKAPVRGFGALSPSCREVARLQSVALDRRLTFLERLGLRFHLVFCKWCRRYGQQIKFLRSVARDQPQENLHSWPQGLPFEARERIKRTIRGGQR
jgi:hypothetical protein